MNQAPKRNLGPLSKIILFLSVISWSLAVHSQLSLILQEEAKLTDEIRDVDSAIGYLICMVAFFIPSIRQVINESRKKWHHFLTISGYASLALAILGTLPSLIPILRDNSGFIKILLHSLTGLSTILALGGETYERKESGESMTWKITSLGKVLVLVIASGFILSVAESSIQEINAKRNNDKVNDILSRIEKVGIIVDELPNDIQDFSQNLDTTVTRFDSSLTLINEHFDDGFKQLTNDMDESLGSYRNYFRPIQSAYANTKDIKESLLAEIDTLNQQLSGARAFRQQLREEMRQKEAECVRINFQKDTIISQLESDLASVRNDLQTVNNELHQKKQTLTEMGILKSVTIDSLNKQIASLSTCDDLMKYLNDKTLIKTDSFPKTED